MAETMWPAAAAALVLLPHVLLLAALGIWRAYASSPHGAWRLYLGLLLTQTGTVAVFLVLQCLAAGSGASDSAGAASGTVAGPSLAIGVAFDLLFLLLDALVSKAGFKHEAALRTRRELAEKEEQLQLLVREYGHVQEASREFSHMRHDIRNQAQVIAMLLKSGDEHTALEHLDALISKIRQPEVRS